MALAQNWLKKRFLCLPLPQIFPKGHTSLTQASPIFLDFMIMNSTTWNVFRQNHFWENTLAKVRTKSKIRVCCLEFKLWIIFFFLSLLQVFFLDTKKSAFQWRLYCDFQRTLAFKELKRPGNISMFFSRHVSSLSRIYLIGLALSFRKEFCSLIICFKSQIGFRAKI